MEAPPTASVWTAQLRGLGFSVGLGRRRLACGLCPPPTWGQHEAAAEEIEARAAKHLAFEHFEAVDMPLHGTRTPGERDTRLDGRIVITQPVGKALQGLQGTAGGALQPGIALRRLPLTDQGGTVLH